MPPPDLRLVHTGTPVDWRDRRLAFAKALRMLALSQRRSPDWVWTPTPAWREFEQHCCAILDVQTIPQLLALLEEAP